MRDGTGEIARPGKWELAAWYGLAVMILVTMAGNSISPVLTLLTEPMKSDLDLSDAQIGALRGIANTLVAAIASYPLAWLADRIDRRIVFAVCVLIWSMATIGIGLAPDFNFLILFSVGLAFGEAILGPVTFSIIPELFTQQRRMLANSIFFISQLLGVAIGMAAGAYLIRAVEHYHQVMPAFFVSLAEWRVTVIASSIPSLILIPLIFFLRLKSRPREVSGADKQPHAAGLAQFIRTHVRTLAAIFVGFGLIGAANFTVFAWLAVVIIRSFGAAPASVGLELGQIFAVSSISGVILANLAVRPMQRRNPDTAPLRLAQLGAFVALGSSLFYLFATSTAQFYAIAVVQIAGSFGALVLSPTITQNVAPAQFRARLIALGGMFYIIFGALSPLLVGLVSDGLGSDPRSLLHAMLIIAVPAFAAGVFILQLGMASITRTLRAAEVAA